MPAVWPIKKNLLLVLSVCLSLFFFFFFTVTLSVCLSGEAVCTRHKLFPPGREGAGALKNSAGRDFYKPLQQPLGVDGYYSHFIDKETGS